MSRWSIDRRLALSLGAAFMVGAAWAQAPAPAPEVPAAPGTGANPGPPAGPGRARPTPAALTNPGVTRCATQADFLAYHNLSCPQTGGMPLPAATAAQLEKNKELVLRFYQGDRSVIADNLIQHDPAEPSTRKAWEEFFGYRMKANQANHTSRPNLGGPMGYGVTPVDGNNQDINYLIAEGDIVIALRFRWWDWPGGPEPVYKGVFADIWRIKDGKLAEQWCTGTPEDATATGIEMAKRDGKWVKFKNLNEQ